MLVDTVPCVNVGMGCGVWGVGIKQHTGKQVIDPFLCHGLLLVLIAQTKR